jgi:hypothetical protein
MAMPIGKKAILNLIMEAPATIFMLNICKIAPYIEGIAAV